MFEKRHVGMLILAAIAIVLSWLAGRAVRGEELTAAPSYVENVRGVTDLPTRP